MHEHFTDRIASHLLATDLQNFADAVVDDIENRISKKLESFLPSATMGAELCVEASKRMLFKALERVRVNCSNPNSVFDAELQDFYDTHRRGLSAEELADIEHYERFLPVVQRHDHQTEPPAADDQVANLQRRLDWVRQRCEDARENFHKGVLRRGSEQEDFNFFLDCLERIADGRTAQFHDSYPPLEFDQD